MTTLLKLAEDFTAQHQTYLQAKEAREVTKTALCTEVFNILSEFSTIWSRLRNPLQFHIALLARELHFDLSPQVGHPDNLQEMVHRFGLCFPLIPSDISPFAVKDISCAFHDDFVTFTLTLTNRDPFVFQLSKEFFTQYSEAENPSKLILNYVLGREADYMKALRHKFSSRGPCSVFRKELSAFRQEAAFQRHARLTRLREYTDKLCTTIVHKR